jgi:hypothetical protein
MGAAMATLAASLHPPKALYTFGSPRVGNPDFAASLPPVKVYRVVHPTDMVQALPPSIPTTVYRHVGEIHAIRLPRGRQPEHRRPSLRHSAIRVPVLLAGHGPLSYTIGLR